MPNSHEISASEAGQRLDKLLAGLPEVGSRDRARKVLASGKATLDDQIVSLADAARVVQAGQRLDIAWNRPNSAFARIEGRQAMTRLGITILYEDRWLLAIDKPAGLLTDTATHAQAKDRDSVRERAGAYLRPAGARAFVVHRIDRDTSGVVLIAKDAETSAALRQSFERHEPERLYVTLLHGVLAPREGVFADWMTWDPQTLAQVQTEPHAERSVLARASYRTVRVLAQGRASVVEVALITGRRNQIRLHALIRGCPLVGEKRYVTEDFDRQGLTHPRQALHAARLGLIHPTTGARLSFESPLPADLEGLIRRLSR